MDASLAEKANAVGDAYLELGCEASFTCAPYLLPNRPRRGEDVVWGESNAVVYSNSVSRRRSFVWESCRSLVGFGPFRVAC